MARRVALTAALLPLLCVPAPASGTVDTPPLPVLRVTAGFQLPAQAYGPGHRGVDLLAGPGDVVRAPISGIVAFSGAVAGRGVITISDGSRLVTLEPVVGGASAGTTVVAGQPVARVGAGGHCWNCLHLGLRVDGRYVPPLRLHAVLVG